MTAPRFAFRVEIGTDPAAEYSYTIDGGEPQTLQSGDMLDTSPRDRQRCLPD